MTIGVFDLSNYAKRAYHAAYRDPSQDVFTNDAGLYSGMIQMALSLVKTDLSMVSLDHCVFAVDFAVDSWRKKLFAEYKKSRGAPEAEWIRQINFLIDIFGTLGLKSKFVQGLEADDLFGIVPGTFQDHEVVIFTNDKDAGQLLTTRRIKIFDPYTRAYITRDDVVRKFGVPPEYIRDYLALNGDSGDDIPGLDNIGPKTSIKIIQSVVDGQGTVEDWIRKNRKNPEFDIERYHLFHKLTAICTRDEGLFPWPRLTLDDIKIDAPDRDQFMHLWTTKGKISVKPHPILDLISGSRPKRGLFDD